MGNIGDWGAGATPNKGNAAYYGGDILWLRTGELNEGYVYDTEIKITQKALEECSLRRNRIGDVLIAMYGATIGKVAIAGVELTTNQACCACTPIEINNEYLFYFLMGSKEDFIKQGEGGAQPNISREKLIKHLIPIPPSTEQNRIVELIKRVLPIITHYDIVKSQLDDINVNITEKLKNSILQEAIQGKLVPQIASDRTAEELLAEIRAEKMQLVKVGKLKKSAIANESRIFQGEDNRYYEQIGHKVLDISDIVPFDIPDSWQWVRLNHIGMSELGKTMDKGKDSGETLPYLCSINVYWDGVRFDKVKTAQFSPNEKDKYKLQFGDLLVCEGGDVGRCAIWQERMDMWFQNALHRITLFKDLNAQYIKYILEYYKFSGVIDKLCKGVTIKHFTQTTLYSLLFPLPPLDEQQRIVDKVKALQNQFR